MNRRSRRPQVRAAVSHTAFKRRQEDHHVTGKLRPVRMDQSRVVTQGRRASAQVADAALYRSKETRPQSRYGHDFSGLGRLKRGADARDPPWTDVARSARLPLSQGMTFLDNVRREAGVISAAARPTLRK